MNIFDKQMYQLKKHLSLTRSKRLLLKMKGLNKAYTVDIDICLACQQQIPEKAIRWLVIFKFKVVGRDIEGSTLK